MSKSKQITITVQGTTIGILPRPEGDYISLTDMARNFDGAGALIEQWLKNKDTILFLGVWERINNPHFNSPEFEGIRNEAGRNSFFLSAKKWIHLTGAKGLIPICYGASENVYPSGMCLDMGSGSRAYLWGKKGPLSLVDIFATGPEVIPSTVADQSDSFAKK